jgi:3-hydroxyisobutyrate dehydrogenase
MSDAGLNGKRLGWVGAGRMGASLAARLLEAGCDVAVYNRTRAKAEPLAELGATLVDAPSQLADRDKEVVCGDAGILSGDGVAPGIVVDATTVSPEVSAEVREQADRSGTRLLAAPVSGNPKVAGAGKLTIVVSGPEDAFLEVRPYLELLAVGVTYVGEGERARLVKICHNIMLGVVAQSLAEITVLAEKGGISRADFLAFLNDSVMGSMFTRYKTPALVNLDFTPTFTPALLLKDFDLGFEAARGHGVPMPVAAAAAEIVRAMQGAGYDDVDFAALLEIEARGAGLELEPENVEVSDGLGVPAESEPAPVSVRR